MEISQPSQKQGPVVAAHQFLADPDELVDEALAFCPSPSAFFVAFPPNNAPVADLLDRQCVLVPFASPKIWLDHLRGDRAFWKGQTETNRAPVGDIEMSVVILEQGVHAPVEVAEGVGVLPADARHVGAAGTTPGIPQAFVRDRSVDGRELVILVLAHGYAFSELAGEAPCAGRLGCIKSGLRESSFLRGFRDHF